MDVVGEFVQLVFLGIGQQTRFLVPPRVIDINGCHGRHTRGLRIEAKPTRALVVCYLVFWLVPQGRVRRCMGEEMNIRRAKQVPTVEARVWWTVLVRVIGTRRR